MFVVCVTFDIHDAEIDRFLPLMRRQAEASLALETGCKVFDVCRSEERPSRVFLYEVYTDRAAFDAHLASAHFRKFDASVSPMVADKRVQVFHREALSGAVTLPPGILGNG